MAPPVNMIDPATGKTFGVEEAEASRLEADGWKREGAEQKVERLVQERKEDEYGGVVGTVTAAGAGALRTASGGLSDVAFRALGVEDEFRDLKEVNPGASMVGEIGGAFLPTGAVSAAARAGKAVGTVAEGAGVGARLFGAAKGAAVEGAIFGAGTGVSELALSKDPITIDRMVSSIGSHALFGGAVGGAAGGLTKAAGIGLSKAKTALDDMATRAASGGDDAARVAAAEQVSTYRTAVKEANPWSAITDGEPASLLSQSDRSLRKLMNDPIGLSKNPGQALKALRVQEQAFTRALDKADDIAAKLEAANVKIAKEIGEELATLPSKVDEVVLAGKSARRYASFADVKVPKGGSVKVSREQAGKFLSALEAGEVSAAGQGALKKLPTLLEQNRGLQAAIEGSTAKAGASAASAATGAASSVAQNMLGGTAFGLVAGAVGAVAGPGIGALAGAAASKFVTEGLGKSAAAIAARGAKAIGTVLQVGGKVAPVAPVLATKFLAGMSYGDSDEPKPKKSKKAAKSEPKLADSYEKRTGELMSKTMYDADGRVVMRPEAREKMAAQIAGVRAVDPVLADRMETGLARRVEYLASMIPRQPDVAALQVGPMKWSVSEMKMRAWARIANAVEDPIGVVERLGAGSITPGEAKAFREVYPEMYADIQQQIWAKLPLLQQTLPYQKRLALSIFSGMPVDPALDPRVLSVLQASYVQEPGTEGGTQAPTPQPQFGSVKATEKPTTAQAREAQQGATA